MVNLPNGLAAGFLDLVYPPRCLVCASAGIEGVCSACGSGLAVDAQLRCTRCAAELRSGSCHECRTFGPFPFTRGRVAAKFDGSLRDAILRFKYAYIERLDRPLGLLVAQRLRASPFRGLENPLLVPVPLHSSRIRSRGFNQAQRLAAVVSLELGWEQSANVLRRVRKTTPQARLPAEERAANVLNAFAVRSGNSPKGRNVVLVDDVLTTCHTASECARVLLGAGAASVSVAAVARGA